MPSLRVTAIAALATAALVVPATASAQVHTGTIGPPTQLQVNLPPESAWTSCAAEGARCEFTGTRQVRYGANGKFTLPREFTNGVACDNATFGDPAPYVAKECQVTGGSQAKDEAATAAAIGTQQSVSKSSEQAASSAPACGATAAQQAELAEMVEKLNQQLAQGQGDVGAVAQTIAEMQKIASAAAQPGAVNDAAQKAAADKAAAEKVAMKMAADKAAQQAAQGQGTMSTADQVLAAFENLFNSIFPR